jgi:hypothetical protein
MTQLGDFLTLIAKLPEPKGFNKKVKVAKIPSLKPRKIKVPKYKAPLDVKTKKELSPVLKAPKAISPANVKISNPKPSPKVKKSPSRKTQEWWEKLGVKEQKQYLKEHPKSKFKMAPKASKDKTENKQHKVIKKAAESQISLFVKPESLDSKDEKPVSDTQKAKAKDLGEKIIKAEPNEDEIKVAVRHLDEHMPSKLKESFLKAAAVVRKVQAKSKEHREEHKKLKADMKAGKISKRDYKKQLKENKKAELANAAELKEPVKKLSMLGALVKTTAILGLGGLSVLSYHLGGIAAAKVASAHMIELYQHNFSGRMGSFSSRRDDNDNFTKLSASLGSHGGHKGHSKSHH